VTLKPIGIRFAANLLWANSPLVKEKKNSKTRFTSKYYKELSIVKSLFGMRWTEGISKIGEDSLPSD
jgi:hypothetical protein